MRLKQVGGKEILKKETMLKHKLRKAIKYFQFEYEDESNYPLYCEVYDNYTGKTYYLTKNLSLRNATEFTWYINRVFPSYERLSCSAFFTDNEYADVGGEYEIFGLPYGYDKASKYAAKLKKKQLQKQRKGE